MQISIRKTISAVSAILICATSVGFISSSAASYIIGDATLDGAVNASDAVQVQRFILGMETPSDIQYKLSDVNKDSTVDVSDVVCLRRYLANNANAGYIGSLYSDGSDSENFIASPISQLKPTMPSQGTVKVPIFSIQFPDCTFSQPMSADQIKECTFGAEDKSSPFYPNESMTAYFNRASYGALNLTGDVFTYTAKESISSYSKDKDKLVKEVLSALDSSIDFSVYDANHDGKIDASIFSVPEGASNDDWWPCSGGFGDPSYTVDGVGVGNIMVGNSIPSNRSDFNGTWTHELGHAMGLPDYYKYNSTNDFEGFHGDAGYERMDEATGDFSQFSKLMFGWLKPSQIQVYDSSKGSTTFTLKSGSESGNCVIIPNGTLDSNYLSEYFIIEYVTPSSNYDNKWISDGNKGIRIFHVDADLYTDDWGGKTFAYENYSPLYTKGDTGKRVVRLVNDGNGFFGTGDIINSSTQGFDWYDSNGQETVNPNVSVSVGNLNNGEFSVTVSNAN